MSTLTQLQGVCQEITTRLFNGFIYLAMYPPRFHHQREHHTHPEAPSCALWVPAIVALPTPSHGSAIVASPNILAVCHRSFPAQPVGTPRVDSTRYYVRPYPYRLMVVLFHGWSLHEPVLRFGYDNLPQASSIAPDKALNHRHHTNKFHSRHPKSYSPH
jgi:hypothetical protein